MSTKTTFKRIALVSVAALGFGMLSAVPSQAIDAQKITVTPVSSATVGNQVKTLVTFEGICTFDGDSATFAVGFASLPALAAPTALPALTPLPWNDNTYFQASSRLVTQVTTNATYYQGLEQVGTQVNTVETYCKAVGKFKLFAELSFTPDVAGDYTFLLLNPALSYTQTSYTISVGARATMTVFGSNTSTVNSTAVGAAVGAGTGSELDGFSAPKTANGVAVETITVTQRNGGLTAATQLTSFNKLTATITGPGLIAWDENGQVPSRASTMGTRAQVSQLNVYGDGTAGVGTITFLNGTTVLGTKKITFYSSTVAKITTVVNHAIIVSGANAADALGYGAVTATVVDADGFPIANSLVYATSDAPGSVALTNATATTDTYGEATFLVTGGAAVGSAKITVANGLVKTATGYVEAAAVSVRRGTATVAKYEMSLDKSSYLPGELATMTILLTDSLGLPVADGAVLTTKSLTSTYALAAGTLPGTTGIIAAAGDLGKYTVKFNMPVNSGEQTFTLALPSTSTVTGNGSVKATITLDAYAQAANETSQAALDAAQEATDAANAATDAANAAAEAADAATAAAQDSADAVAALTLKVEALIANLNAKLTALTNLVVKLQKLLEKKK